LQKKKEKQKEYQAMFKNSEGLKQEKLQLKKVSISPLEYKLNKERLNALGFSPENNNVIIAPKFG